MKLKDYIKYYTSASGSVSTVIRQLGLAGIAVIWVFKIESNGQQAIPPELVKSGAFIVAGLALDFLQILSKTFVWGIFVRYHEVQRTPNTQDIDAPRFINWPNNLFFILKIIAMGVAYFYLVRFLFQKFWTM